LRGSKGYDKLIKFSQKHNSSSKHIRAVSKAAGRDGVVDSSDVDRFAELFDSNPGVVPNDPFSTYVAIGDSHAFA
jgi:hypothetical protein